MSSIARRLADAVSHSLERDFQCFRGELFCENYLSSTVGDVLSSMIVHKPAQVYANRSHYVMEKHCKGKKGPKPKFDFCLLDLNTKIPLVAVECKWAASGHCTPENCLSDIIRLELMAAEGVDCIFLLAGPRGDMLKLLSAAPFRNTEGPPILSLAHGDRKSTHIVMDSDSKSLSSRAISSFSAYKDLEIATHFQTTRVDSLLWNRTDSKFAAVAWMVHKRIASARKPIKVPLPSIASKSSS